MKRIPDAEFVLKMPDVSTGGCSILMLGSGRSGKTTCLKHILNRYFKKHLGAIFSESARAPAYQDMKYPLLPLCSTYVPDMVAASYRINKELKNFYPFLWVLDDCPLVKNDKQLHKTLTIYRNSNISTIIGTQSPTMISPAVRSNFTFVLLFHQNTSEQKEAVIKMFLRGVFPEGWNYDKKIDWFDAMTANHFFLFIDNFNGTIQRCKLTPEQIR